MFGDTATTPSSQSPGISAARSTAPPPLETPTAITRVLAKVNGAAIGMRCVEHLQRELRRLPDMPAPVGFRVVAASARA